MVNLGADAAGDGGRGSNFKIAAAAVSASLLWTDFLWWRSRSRYGDLSGVVSFSSRVIASHRAVESDAEAPLFQDPLAGVLAGKVALKRARAMAQSRHGELPRRLGPIAVRTQWFDEHILGALTPTERVAVRLAAVDESCTVHLKICKAAPAANQCVMLGAGMDTRAWRLGLPAGVRWFEVDQADVLRAKRAAMEAAGAQFIYQPSSHSAQQSPLLFSHQQKSRRWPAHIFSCIAGALHWLVAIAAGRPHGQVHPLKAASWAGIAADLSQPGWVQQLVAQGLDRSQPIVWVAEGLIMYLAEAAVVSLLQQCAAASVIGSRLFGVSVSEEALKRGKTSQSELLQTWQFGLSRDATAPFFERCGWRVSLCTSRSEYAYAYEIQGIRKYVGQARDGGGGSPASRDRQSLFIEALIA